MHALVFDRQVAELRVARLRLADRVAVQLVVLPQQASIVFSQRKKLSLCEAELL